MPKRTNRRLTKTLVDQALPGEIVWDSEVPGFGLRVAKAGTRTFILQYRTRARVARKMTVGRYPTLTVEEARRSARALKAQVEGGGDPARDRQQDRAASTLRDLACYYCDVYAPARKLKPVTVKDAQRLLTRYALPKFGNRKVRDITPADVRQMHSDAFDGSGRYEANRLRAVLSRMFELSIQEEWRTSNPCRGVRRYHEDQRGVFLSLEQTAALLLACDGYPDQVAANAIRLLLFTGARLNEVVKAPWSQFDLERGLWVKPSSHTKTKREHRQLLAPQCVAILREMRDADPRGAYLFPGREGSDKPRSDLKRPWDSIRTAAGLRGFRLHDLRRTNASFMLSTGSDIQTVGKNLGHTQVSTTQRYAHLFDNKQGEGVSRAVDSMIEALRRAA